MASEQSSATQKGGAQFDILVVGHGIAGLTFAIDAKLRGHRVRIIEKNPGLDDFGDVLGVQPSSLRSVQRNWPEFMPRLQAISLGSKLAAYNHEGIHLTNQVVATDDGLGMGLHRLDFHALLHEYAKERGVNISFSKVVTEYFEDAEKGGVVLSDGTKITADLVVAADGVGSHSWNLVLGKKDQAESSGYGVFRANYPSGPALQNPIISEGFGKAEGGGLAFLGKDTHIVISKSQHRIGFLLTHKAEKDLGDVVPITEVLRFLEGWTPFVIEVVKAVPDQKAVDWKLRWRDPQEKWVSDLGRVVQIGDACHSFLPTSAYGASTAMEDGHSLAECLSHVDRQNIKLALQVHNHLRFERTSCAQKMGFKTREIWHKTDWSDGSNNPSKAFGGLKAPWLVDHDPEEYAREKFQDCADHLQHGTPFHNTNSVPGYTYKPWTVKDLNEASEKGIAEQDEGDWFRPLNEL
ncbi:maackiain detoxification [Camillea tinctor]|nr:maackiain detoxification [Camillea tinctor]